MEKKVRRFNFLGVPLDAVRQEDLESVLEQHLVDGQSHQVVLLTISKLLRARKDHEYQRCLRQSSLVLPVSLGIVRGAHFQRKPPLTRFSVFGFTIQVLKLAERLGRRAFLLGSRKETIELAENNLKASFPELNVVGRFTGYFDRDMERNLIVTIRKSDPSFLLVGRGIGDQDKWILRNRDSFSPGIHIGVDNCFDVFSGREKNVSKRVFQLGLESLPGILKKP
jgi:N-acetylglucosaminyldiphosphoundecaprenol N-acetyl-beta-D-mannosaminyltransferase